MFLLVNSSLWRLSCRTATTLCSESGGACGGGGDGGHDAHKRYFCFYVQSGLDRLECGKGPESQNSAWHLNPVGPCGFPSVFCSFGSGWHSISRDLFMSGLTQTSLTKLPNVCKMTNRKQMKEKNSHRTLCDNCNSQRLFS